MKEKQWKFTYHIICSVGIILMSTVVDALFTGGIHIGLIALLNSTSRTEASALGVIGGADGPTAVFFSGNPLYQFALSKMVLFIVLVILFVPTRKMLNKVFHD